jgi:hypothetical protein
LCTGLHQEDVSVMVGAQCVIAISLNFMFGAHRLIAYRSHPSAAPIRRGRPTPHRMNVPFARTYRANGTFILSARGTRSSG